MYSTYMCSLLNFSWDRKLVGHTVFITGASRGIGKAIALKLAKDGANVVIAAKTTEPHPKLPGTIYTAAKEGILSKYLYLFRIVKQLKCVIFLFDFFYGHFLTCNLNLILFIRYKVSSFTFSEYFSHQYNTAFK